MKKLASLLLMTFIFVLMAGKTSIEAAVENKYSFKNTLYWSMATACLLGWGYYRKKSIIKREDTLADNIEEGSVFQIISMNSPVGESGSGGTPVAVVFIKNAKDPDKREWCNYEVLHIYRNDFQNMLEPTLNGYYVKANGKFCVTSLK